MPDHSDIDFDAADHRQRKMLREALADIFSEGSLAMFLDDTMGFDLRGEINQGPFKEQLFDLIKRLQSQGRLGVFMRALLASDEFSNAPKLNDLVMAWEAASVGPAEPHGPTEQREKQPIERILDGQVSRIRPLDWVSGIAMLRRRVCRLRLGHHNYGTGFLVGPDLVMTAAYVHSAPLSPESHDAVFDFGVGIDDLPESGRSVEVSSQVVRDPPGFDSSHEDYRQSLNYALLSLTEPVGEERLEQGMVRGWIDLTGPRERLREGETLLMLHHPKAGPMSMSEGAIAPVTGPANHFAHTCPTEAGSSGAPVVDAALRLVGLHVGKKKSRDLRTAAVKINLAVRADRIAADLEERGQKIIAPPARK